MRLPLEGIRVVEFCNVAAGPFCGMLLADFGADLVKVEHPGGGDTLRHWPPLSDGFSENFASLNRNKRSIALDLKEPDDRDSARRLAADAQVVIENNRPGVMDRLGLGYESLRALNPALVYASISAYGQSGPRAQEGGFDVTVQAMGGVMSVTGPVDGAPAKCGVPIADFTAGLYAAYAITAAIRTAERTGEGCHIDVPMLGTTLAIAALQTSEYFGTGIDPVRLGSAHPRNAPYQAFRARDDHFCMAAGNDALWRAVCETVGRPELEADPRFATTLARAANQRALQELLEALFETQTAAVWLSRFRKAGVPCAPISRYSEALGDEQVEHMGWVRPLTLPNGVETRTFVCPVRFDGETPGIRRGPPALGEHAAEWSEEARSPRPVGATPRAGG